VYSLIEMAHRFDTMSTQLPGKFMCTRETCPCLEYESNGQNSKDLYKKSTKALKTHDRSFVKSSTNFMYFDKSETSFRSFDDCYSSWEKKAKTNKNIDMYRVFNLNPDDFK